VVSAFHAIAIEGDDGGAANSVKVIGEGSDYARRRGVNRRKVRRLRPPLAPERVQFAGRELADMRGRKADGDGDEDPRLAAGEAAAEAPRASEGGLQVTADHRKVFRRMGEESEVAFEAFFSSFPFLNGQIGGRRRTRRSPRPLSPSLLCWALLTLAASLPLAACEVKNPLAEPFRDEVVSLSGFIGRPPFQDDDDEGEEWEAPAEDAMQADSPFSSEDFERSYV